MPLQFVNVDTVSEWLRSWTRNPMGFARMGSNPIGVAFLTTRLFLVLCAAREKKKVQGGFEPPSLDSKSRVLTVTPLDQLYNLLRVFKYSRFELFNLL